MSQPLATHRKCLAREVQFAQWPRGLEDYPHTVEAESRLFNRPERRGRARALDILLARGLHSTDGPPPFHRCGNICGQHGKSHLGGFVRFRPYQVTADGYSSQQVFRERRDSCSPVDNGVKRLHRGKGGGVLKNFFGNETPSGSTTIMERRTGLREAHEHPPPAEHHKPQQRECVARIAVYEAAAAAPRTEDVRSSSPLDFIETASARVHALTREAGGAMPYTVIREVVENFVHADFTEPVISVMDSGTTIRFADQGPGVPDKEKATLPGYTTATADMKHIIRGVGSGLPIVRDFLEHCGGALIVEDNLGRGTVVTITSAAARAEPAIESGISAPVTAHQSFLPLPPISTRQKQVLSLVLELGEVGPTIVSRELSVALSTAYRDLAHLESSGLIAADETGKRVLTDEGARFLDNMFGQ